MSEPDEQPTKDDRAGDDASVERSRASEQRARYRAVLRAPGVRWLLGTSLVARLPGAMVNLAIILRVARASGSYARAGGVTAAYVIGTGLVGPLLGRLADRVGRRPVLLGASAVNGAGLILLAFVPIRELVLLLLTAGLAGASVPPVAPSVRSLWRGLVPAAMQPSLYAMDATLQEVTFMVGPTLVAIVASLASPSAALVTCALISILGTAALAGHSATVRPTGSRRDRQRTPVGSPALLTLVLITLMFLAAVVIVEISVVAFAGRHHVADQSGVLLAVWSTGSLTGGMLFGARTAHAGARVLAPLMLAGAGGFLLLAAAPGVDLLYVLLFIAGVAISPGFSCIYGLVGAVSPAEGSIESFSWVASGIQIGAAIGAAVGGFLVQLVGPRLSFVCAAGCGLGTAAIAMWRTGHLTLPGERPLGSR